ELAMGGQLGQVHRVTDIEPVGGDAKDRLTVRREVAERMRGGDRRQRGDQHGDAGDPHAALQAASWGLRARARARCLAAVRGWPSAAATTAAWTWKLASSVPSRSA